MATIDEIRKDRFRKLQTLVDLGINPYPISVKKDFTLSEIKKKFKKLSTRKKPFFTVGRIIAYREHGGSAFFDLYDGTEKFQCYIKKDEIGKKSYLLFTEIIDVGDFVEVAGVPFLTKKKEKTIKISHWKMLAKSLRPLPDKWHGLTDIEERFRKRYLDVLMSPEVCERFKIRTEIIKEIRNFLDKEDFMEVETPILQSLAGGATALPFKTFHKALGVSLYLRVAPELYLKELLIAGYPKVYELGRSFRNEGIDVTHNPEFTTVEVYEAYTTPDKARLFIEKLFKVLIQKTLKKKKVSFSGETIDFSKKFKLISFAELIKKYALISEKDMGEKEIVSLKAKQLGVSVEPYEETEKILDNIFKKFCRPKIIQPAFVINHPTETSPLAKRKDDNPKLLDRFQLIAGGLELVNGFAELNNPIEQKERFLEQEENKEKGDKEAQPKDETYIEALEYGMPPATGWAIGIDRLVMLLTDTKNIREVIIFPTLRPK